ncbi:MAG: sigma-70 family RNA polymerase sigma factor [Ruminococcaceae bacterium]|nr:sigma-70 family RNA polymerase sigma factor [Oscillospiraceae bacterium]
MRHKDDNIIKLLFDRKEEGLSMIQALYGKLIRSIAFNLYKSDTVAEECLNDTLLDVWNTIPPKNPDSLSAYVCTIARHRTIDRIRADMAQKRYTPDHSEYHTVYEELSFLDDVADGVVDKMEMRRIMGEFLDSLSSTNREIFISRFFDFESLDSIAIKMHMSKNTLGARLHRMRCDLGERLGK